MTNEHNQIFSEVNAVATVVYTELFRLAICNELEHEHARRHIAAEAEADEARHSFSGKLSIIYADEAKGIVRGSVPNTLEEELSQKVGKNISARIKTCNLGSRVLISYDAI